MVWMSMILNNFTLLKFDYQTEKVGAVADPTQ